MSSRRNYSDWKGAREESAKESKKRTRGVSSRDEEEVAKKNFKQAVAEAANKPSPGADVEVPMDLSMTGDEVDSSKALDGDVLMDTTVAGVEAASKPSLEEEKSKGTASDSDEDADSDDELPPITNLKSLTPGKPFIDAPLKLKIIKTPKPIGRKGGTKRVSNIQMQDMEGTKVRMALWDKDLDHFHELESNLGNEILLSGVRLAKMSEENIGYAPDASFPNEILVSGNLELAPVTAKATRISVLTDLIGPIGLVEGELHLKIGRGPKEITVRSTEYRSVIAYDGVHRASFLFPASISTALLKRGSEIVFHKLRLLRFSEDISSTLCVVDSAKDFDVVTKALEGMKSTSLADMRDLFDADVLEKVLASRLME